MDVKDHQVEPAWLDLLEEPISHQHPTHEEKGVHRWVCVHEHFIEHATSSIDSLVLEKNNRNETHIKVMDILFIIPDLGCMSNVSNQGEQNPWGPDTILPGTWTCNSCPPISGGAGFMVPFMPQLLAYRSTYKNEQTPKLPQSAPEDSSEEGARRIHTYGQQTPSRLRGPWK